MTTLTGDTIDLPASALTRAQTLIGAVRDHDPEAVAAIIGCRCSCTCACRRLAALAVTLAALVPDDQTITDLLAWNDAPHEHPAGLPLGEGGSPAGSRRRKNEVDRVIVDRLVNGASYDGDITREERYLAYARLRSARWTSLAIQTRLHCNSQTMRAFGERYDCERRAVA